VIKMEEENKEEKRRSKKKLKPKEGLVEEIYNYLFKTRAKNAN